jgi:hypothetical protein
MHADTPGSTQAIRDRRSHPGHSEKFRSRRAEQSIVSELALAWRPHPTTLTHGASTSILTRLDERARHSLSVGSPRRQADNPRKGGIR